MNVEQNIRETTNGKLPEMPRISPNPTSGPTTITCNVTHAAHLEFRLYDILGRQVRTLVDDEVEEGECQFRWDGKSDAGHSVPEGLYTWVLCLDEEPLSGILTIDRS